MRALIVDDEPAARRRLAALLEELGVAIEGEAPDGLTALALARERRPDVIFLDVSMPEIDGFDVARHLSEPRPLIIFQTAYAQFAVKAFEHEALDYVVKPVRKERLAQAIERARARLATRLQPPGWDAETLERLGNALGYQAACPVRLLVRHGPGHRLVPLQDIVRFSAAQGVVYAHTPSGTPIVDYTLRELEKRTVGQFVRVSRADLVNLSHVVRIAGHGDGSATIGLAEGSDVRVSRRRAAEVRRILQK